MASLHDLGTTQPSVDADLARMGGDRHSEKAPDAYALTAEDWAAIDEGERDADAGRFVSDEDMAKLIPGW